MRIIKATVRADRYIMVGNVAPSTDEAFAKAAGWEFIVWTDIRNPRDDATPEPHELEGIIYALRNTDSSFWDIGAYHGMYALRLAKAGKFVVAFEPNLDSFTTLRKNITANNMEAHVTAERLAVGSVSGMVNISDEGSMSKLGGPGLGVREVEYSTVDELVSQGLRKPDFMKIDTEQHEPEVLKGAVKTLLNVKPKLLIECHRIPLGPSGSMLRYLRLNQPVVEVMLTKLGYSFRHLSRNEDKIFAWPDENISPDIAEVPPL
jgi:FkbM family methyltransferase